MIRITIDGEVTHVPTLGAAFEKGRRDGFTNNIPAGIARDAEPFAYREGWRHGVIERLTRTASGF